MQDLTWTHVKSHISGPEALTKAVYDAPCIIYVYSPTCPACIEQQPKFDREAGAVSGNIYTYNARPYNSEAKNLEVDKTFTTVTGTEIEHYPSVFGFSKAGRVVEYKGSVTSTNLDVFLKALEKT